jgi:hypothetical protein
MPKEKEEPTEKVITDTDEASLIKDAKDAVDEVIADNNARIRGASKNC